MSCELTDAQVRTIVEGLPDRFDTLEFIRVCPRSGGSDTAKSCEVVARERRGACGARLGRFSREVAASIHQTNPGQSPAQWQKGASPVARTPDNLVVRPEHYRALDYMASPGFVEVKALFERFPEIGGVYFRPTYGGVTVVDLHPGSPKPRIGVGRDPLIPVGTRASTLEHTMADRIAWLREVRARQVGESREVRFEARLIRDAQAHQLRLPGFPDRLRFLHSQWRIDPIASGDTRVTDLLAVDLQTGRLVVIELKAAPDASAIVQARSYVRWFIENAVALNPFFLRLAAVVGGLYACPELASLAALETPVAGVAAWPEGTGDGVIVVGLEALDGEAPRPGDGEALSPERAPANAARASAVVDIGPQYQGDPAFRARMRLAQSRYRAEVLRVPCGTGPNEGDRRPLGNMLRPEDGASGLNFLTPAIFELARRRARENPRNVKPFRLFNNLLSSQPMAFNLFGPLIDAPDLATRLFRTLLPDRIERVTRVQIEEAPEPASEYLADNTSFDAFVEYLRPDGARGFVGIETKLTEPFSAKRYDRPEYRRWMESSRAPWRTDAREHVADVIHNQLWRDHLLAIALRDRGGSGYAEGVLLLVHHPGDLECAGAAVGYQKLLRGGDTTFRTVPLDDLVGRWAGAVATREERDWLDRFRRRYLPESVGVRNEGR